MPNLKPNELAVPALNMRRFTWDRAKGELVAEASDLEGFALNRLYNDACDVGIAIRSHHTGRVLRFVLVRVVTDHEGDVLYWSFAPLHGSFSNVRRVTVLND